MNLTQSVWISRIELKHYVGKMYNSKCLQQKLKVQVNDTDFKLKKPEAI